MWDVWSLYKFEGILIQNLGFDSHCKFLYFLSRWIDNFSFFFFDFHFSYSISILIRPKTCPLTKKFTPKKNLSKTTSWAWQKIEQTIYFHPFTDFNHWRSINVHFRLSAVVGPFFFRILDEFLVISDMV